MINFVLSLAKLLQNYLQLRKKVVVKYYKL